MFDVRVVAFAGGSAATLQALQELFGLDRDGAQRLLDNVPLVVRRAAPANEAQNFVDALRGIGAQVALERPGSGGPDRLPIPRPPPPGAPPPPPGARPPPPGARPAPPAPVRLAPPPPPKAAPGKPPPPAPREADPLPRPIMRAPTADLEFDLMSSDGLDEPKSSMQPIGKKGGGTRRNEIDFGGASTTGSLELDLGGERSNPADRAAAPAATSERSAAAVTTFERSAGKTTQRIPVVDPSVADRRSEPYVARTASPEVSRGLAGPMSRAEVVHKPGVDNTTERTRRRQLSLLRVLAAIAIGALGVVFDSSIVYGNASVLSVLVHALAIYQMGVGLRGLAP